MDITTCAHCQNDFPSDDMRTDIHGNLICEVCVEEVKDTSTAIKIFERSGIYEFLWSSAMGFRERDTFKFVPNVPGMYGFDHNGTPQLVSGFVSVVVNWVVGFGDERLKKFLSLMKALTSRQIIPPFPIIITMSQLGELQMGINVIVRESDSSAFGEWMNKTHQLRIS